MEPLSGLAVYIVKWRADGDVAFHGPLSRKLSSAGAKLASRPSKEVSHIVFQRKALATPQELKLEEEQLRELYEKISKVENIFWSHAAAFCNHQHPFERAPIRTHDPRHVHYAFPMHPPAGWHHVPRRLTALGPGVTEPGLPCRCEAMHA